MNDKEQLNRYFDGELTAEELSILEGALRDNADLKDQLSEIQDLANLHRESVPEEKDEFFIEQQFREIQQQLEPETVRRSNVIPFPARWLVNTVGVAAVLLLTVTGIWMWNHSNNDSWADSTADVAIVDTDIDGASSMIYVDEQSGWTFVWLDVPENSDNGDLAG